MKVDEFLEKYLETTLDPLSVDDHYTEDSLEEILECCPLTKFLEDGVVYYDGNHLDGYYHLDKEPEDCFHFFALIDDEDDLDLSEFEPDEEEFTGMDSEYFDLDLED